MDAKRNPLGPWLPVLVAFLGSASLYLHTAAPSIGLGDTALLFNAIRRFDLDTQVNTHNLSVLVGALGQFLPFDDPFYRATLVFGLVGAATVAVFYHVLRRATGNAAVAAIASSALAVSHSQWWHSSLLESYAVNGLLTAIALGIVVAMRDGYRDRQLAALFLLAGLAIFNHVAMGIIALAAAVIGVDRIVRHLRAGDRSAGLRVFRLASLAFGLGFLPYVATFARDVLRSGDLAATLSAALAGKFGSTMFSGGLLWAIQDVSFLVVMQFPGPFLLAILWGAAEAPRVLRPPVLGIALAVMFGANLVFFSTFAAWDRFAHMLPFWIFLAFLGGLGLAELWPRIERSPALKALVWAGAAVQLVLPPYLYSHLAEWGSRPGFFQARFSSESTKNTHRIGEYLANPDKRTYRDVRDFVESAFASLPPSATLIDTDSRTYYVLRLFQADRGRPRSDVELLLVNSWGFEDWGLTKVEFAQALGEAHRYDRDLLLVSLGAPFDAYLRATGSQYAFDRFPIDSKRWLYRLRTASEEGVERYYPSVSRLELGSGFGRGAGRPASSFAAGDDVTVRLHFDANTAPFPVRFEWRDPDGETAFASEPFVVPAGHRRIWSRLEAPTRRAGTWRVRALCDDRVLAEEDFQVQEEGGP